MAFELLSGWIMDGGKTFLGHFGPISPVREPNRGSHKNIVVGVKNVDIRTSCFHFDTNSNTSVLRVQK